MLFSYIPTVYKSWYTCFIYFYERTENPGINTGNFLTSWGPVSCTGRTPFRRITNQYRGHRNINIVHLSSTDVTAYNHIYHKPPRSRRFVGRKGVQVSLTRMFPCLCRREIGLGARKSTCSNNVIDVHSRDTGFESLADYHIYWERIL
jgi:hypothetical protein